MSLSFRILILFAVIASIVGCAHKELTASEHRAQAAKNNLAAQQELAKYDPTRNQPAPPPLVLNQVPSEQLSWNPTEQHLELAERHQRQAAEHQQAAIDLEKFENQACVDVPKAARAACPLFGPSVSNVSDLKDGVKVTLKSDAAVEPIVKRLKCHLAFSQNQGFEKASCPLYVRGVVMKSDDHGFTLTSNDPDVASAIRADAKQIFGVPLASSR